MSIIICNKCENTFDSECVEMLEILQGIFHCPNCYRGCHEKGQSIPAQLDKLASDVSDKDYFFFFYNEDGNTNKPGATFASGRDCDCLEYTNQTLKSILTSILNGLSCEDLDIDNSLEMVLKCLNNIAKEEIQTKIEYELLDCEEEEQ